MDSGDCWWSVFADKIKQKLYMPTKLQIPAACPNGWLQGFFVVIPFCFPELVNYSFCLLDISKEFQKNV